jgi:hypothetical protein
VFGRPMGRHTSRRSLLATVALLLVSALLSAAPASGHTFTKNDANDSPSKIDLRSVSVSHTTNGVVHKVTTWNSWTPVSLQHDSFFVIGINKDSDPAYERCAFIYFTSKLRAQLSNCGSQFISFLPVAKASGTTAKVTIPKNQVGGAYKWYGVSFWTGAAPCRNTCADFAPNTLPDILHDLTLPTIALEVEPLWVWTESTTPDFMFPFSVDDAHSGVESWSLQRRPEGEASWTTIESGLTGGSQNVAVTGDAGRWTYRVVATDRQGNVRTKARSVIVPLDDVDLDPTAFTGTPLSVDHAEAFGGSYTEIDAQEGFSYTPDPTTPCEFILIGPGTGSWVVQVSNGGSVTTRFATDLPDDQRLTLFDIDCTSTTAINVIVTTGGGFGIDAIVGNQP